MWRLFLSRNIETQRPRHQAAVRHIAVPEQLPPVLQAILEPGGGAAGHMPAAAGDVPPPQLAPPVPGSPASVGEAAAAAAVAA
eukprot:COSAG01_NODE_13991_length_1510_cov_1.386960_1_plen_82_part_10